MAVPEDIALAAHRGDVDTVRGFLDQHPESVDQPDVIDDLDAPMNLMQIAVRLAIEPDTRGKTRDLIELLLSHGANVNLRRRPAFDSPTPLHEACLISCPDAVGMLLRAGADVNLICRGPTGDFPASHPLSILCGDNWRHFASRTGRSEEEHLRCMYECVQLLLRAGHPLEMLHMGMESISVEDVLDPIAFGATSYTGDASYPFDAIDLARAVRAAQLTSTSTRLTPWQKYCLLPPKELLRLRSLVARGRARERRRLRSKTPREISLLFAPSFPNELFWKVMAFWNPRY